MWCCENCAIAEGCLLEVSWPMKNIRDVEVDTLDLTLSKARLFTCAAMQLMLSGVAVRGRIWHAAHALARDKSVLSSLWRKESGWLLWRATELRTPFFFQTLKRAGTFFEIGQKNCTHFCVSMGGPRGTTNKKNKNKNKKEETKQKTKLNKKTRTRTKTKQKKRTRKTMRTRRTRSKTKIRTTTKTKNKKNNKIKNKKNTTTKTKLKTKTATPTTFFL